MSNFSIEEVAKGIFIQTPIGKYRSPLNPTNDSIEWAKWSWNPVTGCLFGCQYCYAKKKAENGFFAKGFPTKFAPTFHPGRLSAPACHRIPEKRRDEPGIHNVFLCSMADLFGPWVPSDWIEQVMDAVKANPRYNFIALTKNPKRYLDFEFPENIWLGCTADTQSRFDTALAVLDQIGDGNIKFLSCEPLLEQITPNSDYAGVLDWVIIGGLKGSEHSDRQPEKAWVQALMDFARESGAKLYFKTNLTVDIGEIPKEFPIIM